MIKKIRKSKLNLLWPLIISLLIILVIFISTTTIWVIFSTYTIDDFWNVFLKVSRGMSGYSTLLAAMIATVFFQSYTLNIENDKEMEKKVQSIGHYTLAFQRENDGYNEKYKGEKTVIEINSEADFDLKEPSPEEHLILLIKFLTSNRKSTNLKNIMAFSDEYFRTNNKIVSNYFDYCEKIKFPTPLYCSSKPTSEITNKNEADINRYFFLFIKRFEEEKKFWISGITDDGIMLFIKVSVRTNNITNANQEVGDYTQLIQQTIYFKHNNKLIPLYR